MLLTASLASVTAFSLTGAELMEVAHIGGFGIPIGTSSSTRLVSRLASRFLTITHGNACFTPGDTNAPTRLFS